MNYFLLMAKITETGDTREDLATFLGIHPHTLYMKMRSGDAKKRQDFTQEEIKKITTRYGLTPDEVVKIFFN